MDGIESAKIMMAGRSRFVPKADSPSLHGWVLLFVLERLESPDLAICSTICKDWQKIISDDPELWKGAYLKEKHYIAAELWHYFNSDVEAPNFSQPTDTCSLGENRKRAACWKQAAVALLTWRRFDSGPITSQAVKACPDRLVACRVKGHTTAILSSLGAVSLWDMTSLTRIFSSATEAPSSEGVIEFDSAMVVASCGGSKMKVFSRHSQRVTRVLKVDRTPSAKTIRLHDASLYVACLDGTVKVYDLYSGACSQIIRLCESVFRVSCIHVDPERSLLFAGVSNGYATLYNLEQCTQITRLLYIGIAPTSVELAGEHFLVSTGTTYVLHGLIKFFKKGYYAEASIAGFESALHLTHHGGSLAIFKWGPGVECVQRLVPDVSESCIKKWNSYVDRYQKDIIRNADVAAWATTPSWASFRTRGDGKEEEHITCADNSGSTVVTGDGNGTFKVWKWGLPS